MSRYDSRINPVSALGWILGPSLDPNPGSRYDRLSGRPPRTDHYYRWSARGVWSGPLWPRTARRRTTVPPYGAPLHRLCGDRVVGAPRPPDVPPLPCGFSRSPPLRFLSLLGLLFLYPRSSTLYQ